MRRPYRARERRGLENGFCIVVNNLIINVEQIEEPRQLERRPLTRAFLDEIFADAPEYKVAGPAELQAHLTRVGETDVLLEASTTLQLTSACRRCLTEVKSDLPVVFTLNLVARKEPEPAPRKGKRGKEPVAEEEEETLSESDTESEEYDGETIDLAPILREQLLLGLPAIEPLCKEACKGLCPTCGQDLNEKDCGHGAKQPDSRWAALKNLKA